MIRIFSRSHWHLPFVSLLLLSACSGGSSTGPDSNPGANSSSNNSSNSPYKNRPGNGDQRVDGADNNINPRVSDPVYAGTTVPCGEIPDYFAINVWPEVQGQCISCHNPAGSGGASNFVLYQDQAQAAPDNVSDFMAANLERFTIAAAKADGESSIMLVKPLSPTHGGGVRYTDSTNAGYQELVTLSNSLQQCTVASPGTDSAQAGIMTADAYQSLRKATLALAGRLPTAQEEAAVQNAPTQEALQIELNNILDQMLTEPAFYERLKELYNDLLLTNKYLRVNGGDFSRFDALKGYKQDFFVPANLSASYSRDEKNMLHHFANDAIAQEPLELIANIVKKNKPFTEVLTANYIMVNAFSAAVYGVTGVPKFVNGDPVNKYDPTDFREARINGIPHAGVLTSPMFLSRFPSTDTNRNRARAKYVFLFFLNTDVESLANRESLDLDKVADPNPTLTDPQCTVCHSIIDPVAGTFKNWNNDGVFGVENWPNDMRAPGFSERVLMPSTFNTKSLQWLAGNIVADKRFAESAVRTWFTFLTGQAPLSATVDVSPALQQAVQEQTQFFLQVENRFKSSNYNLKEVIKGVITSDYFRAVNANTQNTDPLLLSAYGTGQFLSPEQLTRKLRAVTGGYSWGNNAGLLNSDRNLMLWYGGINSDDVTTRLTAPNGLMANIQQRLAFQTSCEVVPAELSKPAASRVLFPAVEISDVPDGAAGTAKIKQGIQGLYKRILGDVLPETDINIVKTYELFEAVHHSTPAGGGIPAQCRINTTAAVNADAQRTVQSWMAVTASLLSDYKFYYE